MLVFHWKLEFLRALCVIYEKKTKTFLKILVQSGFNPLDSFLQFQFWSRLHN